MKGKADMLEMLAHLHIDRPEWVDTKEIEDGGDLINIVLADWEPPSREAIVKSLMLQASFVTGETEGAFYWITGIVLGIQFGREMGRMRSDTPEPE